MDKIRTELNKIIEN